MRIQAAHVNSNAHLHFQNRDDVGNWHEAQPKALPQLQGILLSLNNNVSRQYGPLRRIISSTLNAKKIFQLKFGSCQIGEQMRGGMSRIIPFVDQLSELGRQVDMNGFVPE